MTNILSQSNSKNNYFRQQYGLERGGNNIHYYADASDNELNLITNILNYNQKTSFVDIDATFSHSYSENISPDSWNLQFEQLSVGTNQINDKLSPILIADLAHKKVLMDQMNLRRINTSDSFTKQRELRGALDFTKDLNIADILSVQLKAGGMYAYTDRSYDYNDGNGSIVFGEVGNRIVQAYPWLTSEYGISGSGTANLFLTPFLDPNMNIGTFLNDDYIFDGKLNLDYTKKIKEIIVDYDNNLGSAGTGG
ncbi:MAG: hypothetical protein KDC90_13130, partial [Ignavibacteriae bacterium]|nr:hypothetical protein [Ignavibacteriota bacterium]